jgi:hypothetical protein
VFLATDSKPRRENKVRRYLDSDPGMALLLAAVNFEWTVCRAVLFLSKSPNSALRHRMGAYYSLDGYKKLWKLEVVRGGERKILVAIVRN